MARSVTVTELIRRIRQRADMRSSAFFTDAEILDLLNEAYPELYDTLVQAFQNYYTSTTTLTLTAGTSTYDLPTDFYKSIGLDLLNGSQYDTLFPFNENERNSAWSVSSTIPNATVRLRYIPAPAVLTSLSSIDGVSGWDALLVTDVAIMLLDTEEANTDRLERRRQRIMQRIMSASQNRDVSMPGRVTDVTVYDHAPFRDVLRYRFYGNQVEFINVEYVGVP